MPDRTKLLIHVSRLAQVIRAAHRQGPDPFRESTILAAEQPEFVHYSTALYLAGCLAFLEGEDGAYSWTQPSPAHADFDSFVASHPPGKTSFLSRGISSSALNALACIRNAVTHNNGDLAKNRNPDPFRESTILRAAWRSSVRPGYRTSPLPGRSCSSAQRP